MLNQPGSGPSPSDSRSRTPENVFPPDPDDDNVEKNRPQHSSPQDQGNNPPPKTSAPEHGNNHPPKCYQPEQGNKHQDAAANPSTLNPSSLQQANIQVDEHRQTVHPSVTQPSNFMSVEEAAGFNFGMYTSLFANAPQRPKRYHQEDRVLKLKLWSSVFFLKPCFHCRIARRQRPVERLPDKVVKLSRSAVACSVGRWHENTTIEMIMEILRQMPADIYGTFEVRFLLRLDSLCTQQIIL